MVPLIQEGDTVLVSHADTDILPGDVLVFRQNGELVAHRVIAIHQMDGIGCVYDTQGDNSPFVDPPLQSKDILGRVIAIQDGERSFSIDSPVWRWINFQIARVKSISPARANILNRTLKIGLLSILKAILVSIRWWKLTLP
jgi:signal peptidase I